MNHSLRIIVIGALCGLILGSSATLEANPNPQDENASVKSSPKDTKGLIFVKAACTACHSAMVIESASKNRTAWDKTITKMETQGMQPLPESIRNSILDFLAEEQGIDPKTAPPSYLPWASQADANPLWPL